MVPQGQYLNLYSCTFAQHLKFTQEQVVSLHYYYGGYTLLLMYSCYYRIKLDTPSNYWVARTIDTQVYIIYAHTHSIFF